jgi:hypothetical protein
MKQSQPIGILDLLQLQGFDLNQKFKLVRHQTNELDLQDYLRRGWFDAYQAFQGRPVFDDVDFIVSFIGAERTRARLVGVYKVLSAHPGSAGNLPEGCRQERWLGLPRYYEMEQVPGFEELEHRVVIEWGPATRSWAQWPKNKEVVELLPKGQLLKPFDDYMSFTLTHGELKYLFSRPEGNKEWRARLSAVAGVYLILATTTGAQYVGSAAGMKGFWGRWESYAQNGHGGNKLLQELVNKEPAYPAAFSYSILQILPPTTVHSEVLKWEQLHKEKLGSKAVGLNDN